MAGRGGEKTGRKNYFKIALKKIWIYFHSLPGG
jgi:hypothetical protein